MFRLTNLCLAMLLMLFFSACGGGGGGGTTTGTTSSQPASVVLTADKTSATANSTDTITITAVVQDVNGSSLSGQTVNFTVPNGPVPSATTAATDGNGRASITLTCPAIGSSPYNRIVSVTATCGPASSNAMSVDFADPWAGPRITVTANGNDTFTVTADALVDISGIIFTLNYDATLLGSPSVSPGDLVSGALVLPNTLAAGTVRVAAISVVAFPSSGTFITLRNVTGRIVSANAEIATSGSQTIPVQVIFLN